MSRGLSRELIALRVAKELKDGMYVNLGMGLPLNVANLIPRDAGVMFHSENGILGYGPMPEEHEWDAELVGAQGQPLTLLPGACFFHSVDSFVMLRGGRVDVAILGAFQVSERGDLANWMTLEQMRKSKQQLGSMGGAMDIACGAKRLLVMMEHVTPRGEARILRQCTYPLTAQGVVNTIFTDLAVLEVASDGLILKEIAPGITVDEVQAVTEPRLIVSQGLKEIDL